VHPKWFARPWYVRRKPCTHLESRLALSPNRPSFHLSLVTLEYHRVHPKRFLSWWYVWHKLCIYLASTLTLSPNEKKWDFTRPTSARSSSGGSKMISDPMVRLTQIVHYLPSRLEHLQTDRALTWASSPQSIIGCVQNSFWAGDNFGANCAPILRRHSHCLQTERSEIPHNPRHLGAPSGASKTISEPILRSMKIMHLSCVKISTISDRSEFSLEPHDLGVPSGASKTILNPMVRLTQNCAFILHRH
jgi:hypothetical protein